MIHIENLSFSYPKGKTVFTDVSLQFTKKFNVIIGPNASGKSTFLKCLFGILPARGSMYYKNTNLLDLSTEEKMRLMAYLPQEETGNIGLTVFEMVLLGCLPQLSWNVRPEDTEAVMSILRLLHIEKLALSPFVTLSGGQQKLVSIAQTLVRDPEIVLMDEPTNNLDLQKQLELCETIRSIIEQHGITFIVVLHDLGLAARFADEIFVFQGENGLYYQGNPAAAINAEMLRKVYGVQAEVFTDKKGIPVIAPFGSVRNISDKGC